MSIMENATQQWSVLADLMEGLLTAWDEPGDPPSLESFLPPVDDPLRVVALVELIKIDLEQRKTKDFWQPLEWYSTQFPELLENGEPPCDLIYEEYHLCKAAGEAVDPQAYFRRFPKCQESLARLLDCCEMHHTLSLAAGRPKITFQAGDSVEDFDLLTSLGSGAFATVFLARQRSMQRLVALKISSDKGNEPQTLANLDHPHIVRVYDQRRLPEHGLRLMYMQYAPGGTLHEVAQRSRRTIAADRTGKLLVDSVNDSLDRAGYGPPELSSQRQRLMNYPWAEMVCRLGIQLAQALDYAHRHGVLHRDVKPANVLLTAECTPKLADFNISFSNQLEGATPAAYFGGSLAYMSPEQLEACNPQHARTPDSLDGRSDLFSLAALLWELLFGERPFREEGLTGTWTATLEELTRRRIGEPPQPPPIGRRDELTRPVVAILSKCLSPKPEDRSVDGANLARDLALCLQPRARRLLEFPQGGFRQFLRRWPLVSCLAAILIPNGLAGVFNYLYNGNVVVDKEDYGRFEAVSLALNIVYFSIGALLVQYIVGPAMKRVCAVKLTAEEAIQARRQMLRSGHLAAILGSILWLSSGIAFPLFIQLAGGNVPSDKWGHFFASMMICGLVAASYPFFGMTYLVTHAFFPALLSHTPGTADDEVRLVKLSQQAAPYLLVAVGVPLLGTLMMVLWGSDQRVALIALICAGISGLGAAYWLFQRIRDDIEALIVAVRPIDSANSFTDTSASV